MGPIFSMKIGGITLSIQSRWELKIYENEGEYNIFVKITKTLQRPYDPDDIYIKGCQTSLTRPHFFPIRTKVTQTKMIISY